MEDRKRQAVKEASKMDGIKHGKEKGRMDTGPYHIIARIHNCFSDKFGIPRQAGLVEGIISQIVFEKEYRDRNAFRGIEDYSHLWLIWEFSENRKRQWSPTVRPPRLGGNARIGVFATRSPYRPNPIGLSCVALREWKITRENGPVLVVEGADLMDGTPILDIKPYLKFTDSHPNASSGFAKAQEKRKVVFPPELMGRLPEKDYAAVLGILAEDPKPAYQKEPGRIYGMKFGGYNIRFRVGEGEVTVCEVEKQKE